MPDPTPTSLASKTLDRLRALAKGNGMDPASITVFEATESTQKVEGLIRLRPDFKVAMRTAPGRPKSKDHRMLRDFAALNEAIEQEKKDFMSSPTWLGLARDELKKTPGLGWGHADAELHWDGKAAVLVATENCTACRGSAMSPCNACQGLGYVMCPHCRGRLKEMCPICGGSGRDGHDPNKPCYNCHGEQYSDCRFCRMLGKMPCESCKGNGHIPCTTCKGSGVISKMAQIQHAAILSFSLGQTTELPSGLLRMLQRVGDTNLHRYADISIQDIPPDEEKSEDQSFIHLIASVPYAEIKMSFGAKKALVVAFGKTGRISGAPAFLDDALKPARKALATGNLDKAQEARALKDALRLALAIKTHPNELRRLYPVGLSGDTAQEIMRNMVAAIKNQTKSMRSKIGWGLIAFSALATAGFYMTPLFPALATSQTPTFVWAVEGALPLALLGSGWAVLTHFTRWALTRKHPEAQIGMRQNIGRTGMRALIGMAVVYIVILVVSGRIPTGLF